MAVTFTDGRSATDTLAQEPFEPSSAIESSTHLPQSSSCTFEPHGAHDIVVEIPQPTDLASLRGRPTIYLDQDRWSALTHIIHEPDRVANKQERIVLGALRDSKNAAGPTLIVPVATAVALVKAGHPDR